MEEEFIAPDKQQIQHDLKAFDFKNLFVEGLGWEYLNEPLLPLAVKEQTYTLHPLVHKRGVKVYVCDPDAQGRIPNDTTLRQIDREVTKYAYEHILIYVDAAKENQWWQWVKRERDKPLAPRVNKLHKGQSGDALAQKLTNLAVEFSEEEGLTTPTVSGKVAQAFDVERVTKRFFDRFQKEHTTFLNFIQGFTAQGDREWYTSLMLNRLMFIYFIQRQGFLDTKSPGKLDGDTHYLRNRLERTKQQHGPDTFHSFYRYFLLTLFHDGLSKRERSAELEKLLGKVPYLNGGLFDVHQLERANPDIQIPDEAFERIFDFFDEFDWHLDDRPTKAGNEINPDVLGYIFEKYINQKQMGAYYTKEDITEYISKNTILPSLFEAAEKESHISFSANGPVWSLLRDNPDRYIYAAVKKGTELPLPAQIAVGLHDIARRTEWNKPAAIEYALPTEIWREVVARRTRYEEVRAKLAAGEVTSINDLITYNLDIRQFAQDVIIYCEGSELLLAFYEALAGREPASAYQPAKSPLSILDPTCGSGAFLFAALTILEPLYEACLDRMHILVEERDQLDAGREPAGRQKRPRIESFRAILHQVAKHHNREYFILKSIIINNLYGVDIMEEATEICKLRLFLKLVAQVKNFNDIEPLPDIDFNIRAGNTLVGFASLEEVQSVVTRDMRSLLTSTETLARIEQQAQEVERGFVNFRELQTKYDLQCAESKQQLREKLDLLRDELDRHLAKEYGVDPLSVVNKGSYKERVEKWRQNHQPFHWFVEFYGIMQKGGFDVIIGNPPYVEYYATKFPYILRNFKTLTCANLYTCVIERSHYLLSSQGYHGMILPLSAFATKNMTALIEGFQQWFPSSWLSFYHFRPSMLFSGGKVASIPTTIYITKASGKESSFSTNVVKWSTEHRDALFSSLSYSKITAPKDLDNQHYYPKYGAPIENAIMEKVLAHKKVSSYLTHTPNQNTMYYRSAGGLYWKVFVNFAWPYQSTSNKQCFFQNGKDRDIFVALFNSSLFWWYYTVTFDTFNLKDYMIFGFRFSYPQDDTIIGKLRVYSHFLMDNFRENAKHLKRGKTDSYTVYARHSKPIIDEIDRVLARHYAFTDEELDFIINYDIKYRMGRNNGEESEE